MLMNALAVYTAVTVSLHVRTPLGPTAVHVNSISMETVKTASTQRVVSTVVISLDKFKKVKRNSVEGEPTSIVFEIRAHDLKPKIVPSRLH